MGDDFNPLKAIFDTYNLQLQLDAENERAARSFSQGQLYGVNEYGQPFVRGASASVISSPAVLVVLGLAAVAGVVWLVKG